jgi:hypothetical protein
MGKLESKGCKSVSGLEGLRGEKAHYRFLSRWERGLRKVWGREDVIDPAAGC